MVRSQPGPIVRETLSGKTLHKNRAGRVAKGEGPVPQKKKKRINKYYKLVLFLFPTISVPSYGV
jgi:hypothetical protein